MKTTLRKSIRKGIRRAATTRRLRLEHLDERAVCSANHIADPAPADPPPDGGSQANYDTEMLQLDLVERDLTGPGPGPGPVYGPQVNILTGPGPGAVFGPHVRGFTGGIPTELGNLSGAKADAVFGLHVRAFKVAAPQEPGLGTYAQAVDQVLAEDRVASFFDVFVETEKDLGGDGPMPQTKAADSFFDITYRIDFASPGPRPVSGAQSDFAYGTLKYGVNFTGADSVWLPGTSDLFIPIIILHCGQTAGDPLPMEEVSFN